MFADNLSKLTHCITLGSRTRDPSHREFGEPAKDDMRFEVSERHDGKWTVVRMIPLSRTTGRIAYHAGPVEVFDSEAAACERMADALRTVLRGRAAAALAENA